jgi:16S rRNA (guanine966-N2)-methyltransferase
MRVIAGRLGGRTLVAPRGLATRPTTDRVREALFSSLASVDGARVLDLYAGTGALGIEALSRGAASAVFVEDARPALAALRKNLVALALESAARVVAEPVARAVTRLASGGAPFDLVLADPPYDDADDALSALETLAPAFAPGARIVLEHASRRPLRPTPVLDHIRTRTYGDTAVAFFALRDADAPDNGQHDRTR